MTTSRNRIGGSVHPWNKIDVGKRLSRWALKEVYGDITLVPSGPLFKKSEVQGRKLILHFDYVGSGLVVGTKEGTDPIKELNTTTVDRMALAGEDGKFHWAKAVIAGNTVEVTSDQVPDPVAVRYIWERSPPEDAGLLYNKEGLPASPFRTGR
jgi:sialate O-acetylesterase